MTRTDLSNRSLTVAARLAYSGRVTTLLLLAAFALCAQPGATVEGKVVSASDGAAVRKATVLLRAATLLGDPAQSNKPSYVAETDGSGRFTIAGVAPGAYECLSWRPGFEAGPPDRPAKPLALTVADAQHVDGVTLRLTPVGAISGRVLDADAQPIPDVEVVALQYAYSPTGKALVVRRQSTSDDRGEFRVFGLYPGQYYLCATPLPDGGVSMYRSFGVAGVNRMRVVMGPPQNPVRGPAPAPLTMTYYPSATAAAQARAIEVPAGGEAHDSDIRLQRRQTYSIRGSAPAGILRPIQVDHPADPELRVGFGMVDESGAFEVRGLPSGTYVLSSMFRGGPDAALALAPLTVEVVGHDVEGVQLRAAPAVSVSGTIQMASGEPPKNLQVNLQAAGGARWTTSQTKTGAFQLAVSTDVYHVGLVNHALAYVTSVKSGGQELADGELDLRNQTSAAVTLTVAADFGSVEGQTEPGATVSLIDGQRRWDAQTRYQETVADAQGRFLFAKAAPGRYRAFAWKDVPADAPRDAGFRAPFEKLGVDVTLEPGGKQSLELKAIDTERHQ